MQHGPQIRTELSDKLHSQRVNSLEELCGIKVILETSRSCFNFILKFESISGPKYTNLSAAGNI